MFNTFKIYDFYTSMGKISLLKKKKKNELPNVDLRKQIQHNQIMVEAL